ncbi:MAG: hypothetical protein OXD46_06680 [Chloroflexi bacterium]|nr:hypothetical protein [Chloroflexota bacterium]
MFWWTTILVVLTIGTTVGVLVPVARTMGHFDFRPEPDVTAKAEVYNATVSPAVLDALKGVIADVATDLDETIETKEDSLETAPNQGEARASLKELRNLKEAIEEAATEVDEGVVPPVAFDTLNRAIEAAEADNEIVSPMVFDALKNVTEDVTIEVTGASFSPGDRLFFTIAHENIGGSEAGAVTVNIHLPDELTATSVQPGTPACSQAGKLERFAGKTAGEITGEPGGTMKCLLGTRVAQARGDIILEAEVGDVAEGDTLDVNVWLTSYRTVESVAKDEFTWKNNCTSLTLVAGSGGTSTANTLECSMLGLIAQSIVVKSEPASPAPGEPITITTSFENLPVVEEGEEESIVIDIRLPNELTANTLQQYNDDKAITEEEDVTCSHPSQLEEFTREAKGQITNVPGGTLTCVVGSRSQGAEGRVRLNTSVANVASGSTINVDVCARREQDATAAPGNCRELAVLVQEPEQ